MKNTIPRPEHPRPGFYRENWVNLNGPWEFYNDLSASGYDRALYKAEKFSDTIVVPFCPESKLSGIGYVDFMTSVWYARTIRMTREQLHQRVLLHFGACDYRTEVYVNGEKAGEHVGGFVSFTIDITARLHEGDNRLTVHAADDVRTGLQPGGKQSREYYSHHCDYTRTTGIWQTVWLEFVPQTYLKEVRVNATDLSGTVRLQIRLNRYTPNARLRIQAKYNGAVAADVTYPLDGTLTQREFAVTPVKLWNPGDAHLYDATYTLLIDGKPVDTVQSYFGIRRIDIDGYKVRINGKSVFQRLILDQGFYPDGIYTAPSDEALQQDIRLSMALGFNGARLHQKVFEERFLYHADRLGYLVWGEFPSFGLRTSLPEALHAVLPEWLESVDRDYNHPCIIGWCPYNETWDDVNGKRQIDTVISAVYQATKAADSTRPVIDTSGNYHTKATDIYDVHDYEQDTAIFSERYKKHAQGEFFNTFPTRQKYDGVSPYMVSEYGGIKWNGEIADDDVRKAWGYGNAPKTQKEFEERFCGLAAALLQAPNIMGFCYTQLTDVEQEQNGLYFYDRSPKFPAEMSEKMRAAVAAEAAIEKE